MKKATRIMIEVYDSASDEVLGRLTCDQFRKFMCSKHEFIGTLVERCNLQKRRMNETTRVREVIE